jgi:hypothetical protein
VQEPDLIARLKHPEQHYEFTDPKKANAVLMSLCQEAADALAAPAAQRQWVGLTEDESDEIFNNWPTYNLDHFEFAQVAVAKVFEKNLTTKVTVPDALNPKDENPAYAAGWNDCRAEMLKGNTP